MSTRGVYGFKINNELKVIMSPYDSYPQGLGLDIINFLNKLDLDRLIKKVQALQCIPESLIKDNSLADKELWVKPKEVLQGIYTGTIQSFFNAQEFLQDPLFCEYSYIINLDTKELECYESGIFLSLGNYQMNKITPKIIIEMEKKKKQNQKAKASLLGYKL